VISTIKRLIRTIEISPPSPHGLRLLPFPTVETHDPSWSLHSDAQLTALDAWASAPARQAMLMHVSGLVGVLNNGVVRALPLVRPQSSIQENTAAS